MILTDGERVWMSGMVGNHTTFRLIVTGPVGFTEIERLIQLLGYYQTFLGEDDRRKEDASVRPD